MHKYSDQIIFPPYKGLISDTEVEKLRCDFPILQNVTHLGSCSQGAQSTRVRSAIERYLDGWNGIGMDWDGWCAEVALAKAEFAKMINASPDEIAVAASVSDLISGISNALDYKAGRKKIVVTDAEFPTVNYVWIAAQKNGASVDFVPVTEQHTIDISQYEQHIDTDTLLTSVTQVYYLNGFKQDIGAIAKIAHDKGSLVLVDSYQSLGTDPVDVKMLDIDILTSGCLKYLLGIPGIAFMYVKKEIIEQMQPTITGWFGQANPFRFQSRYVDFSKTAARFDTGTPPVLAAYAARAGFELITEIGQERIKDRIDMLSAHALRGIVSRALDTPSPLDVHKKGSSTAILCPNSHDMEVLLRQKNIIASARGDYIRIAPHFYTLPSEIDYALDAVKEILCCK